MAQQMLLQLQRVLKSFVNVCYLLL